MTINVGVWTSEQIDPLDPFDDLSEFVRIDIEQGLAEAFSVTPDDAGFSVLEGYEAMPGSEDMGAVAWTYRCTHTGPIALAPSSGLAAIPTTNRPVVIEGVTVARELDDNTVEVRRYVDWNLVLAQLGVTMALRPGNPAAGTTVA